MKTGCNSCIDCIDADPGCKASNVDDTNSNSNSNFNYNCIDRNDHNDANSSSDSKDCNNSNCNPVKILPSRAESGSPLQKFLVSRLVLGLVASMVKIIKIVDVRTVSSST